MKHPVKRFFAWLMVLALCLSLLPGIALADLVDYRTGTASYGGDTFTDVIINWGTRGTTATFLSPNAEVYYDTNGISYGTLAGMSENQLYQTLKNLLADTHTYEVDYNETRPLYAFADCQQGDTATLTCFYSGAKIGPGWDSGATWNREHTWPQSKGLKDSAANDEDDIVMLRPTSTNVNSSRGNKAYGEGDSTQFYDPNGESDGSLNVRGDVARSVLYGYVRWDNTSYMWGADGVIESPELLLRWMQEDPVDTWEMGRNDSIESVTGVRNVFIDYPELAFVLLGEAVPTNMVTPSGEAVSSGMAHSVTATVNNSSWGEAIVSGNIINAAPAEGYEVKGCTLVSGTASVTRKGNTFTVNPTSDCVIRIDFAKLEAYDISFSENGTITGTREVFPGSSTLLPQPAAEAPEGYTFLGWVEQTVTATTQKPSGISTPGNYFTPTGDTAFYALYSYLDENGTGGNTFRLYTGEITEGSYLITYADGAMEATITNSRFVVTDISPVSGVVAEPDAKLIWKIGFTNDGYATLFNESTGKYAASTGVANKGKLESAITDNSKWTAIGSETYEFENLANKTKGVNYTLRRNNQHGFAPYATGTGGALTLYKQIAGTVYYATDAVVCEHANTVNVDAVAPTCTQSGYTAGVSCTDCGAWVSGHDAVDALGHSYDVVETAPTCTEKGSAVYTCTVCSSSYTSTLPATGHSFAEGICTECGEADPNYGAPEGAYVLVTSLDQITEGGSFIIVAENEGAYLAMGTTPVSGKIPSVTVNVANSLVTSDNLPVWTLEAVEGGVALTANGKYLKFSSGTSFSNVNDPYTWSVEESNGGFRLNAASTLGESTVRGIIYRLSVDKFAPYATTNATNADYIADLQLYKYQLLGEGCLHNYIPVTEAEATCTVDGLIRYTCDNCGDSYTKVVPAAGHSYEADRTDATCTEDGIAVYTCSVCQDTYSETLPATGHSYNGGICTGCGEADPDYTAPEGGYTLVTDVAEIALGGSFVIAVDNGGSYQAMDTTLSSGKLVGVDITVVDGTVTSAAAPVWTLEAVEGGVALTANGKYLKFSSSTSFATDTAPYTWTLEENEYGLQLLASSTLSASTVRGILYRLSADKFAPYACSNGTNEDYIAGLQLYKFQEKVTPELTVTGSLTSYADGDTTVELITDGQVVDTATVSGKTGSYSFEGVAPGSYTLAVSKTNHVTREYTVIVEGEDVTQDVKICLIGDVSGDGRVNVGDVVRLYSYIRGTATIEDEYLLKCANVNGGSLNIGDAVGLYGHCRGTKKLY